MEVLNIKKIPEESVLNSKLNSGCESPQNKCQTSEVFLVNKQHNKLVDDVIQTIQNNQETSNKQEKQSKYQRKQLYLLAFLGITCLQSVFTLYPAFIFTRTSGTYEFMLMELFFPIGFIMVSYYFLRSPKAVLKYFFLLDPMMIVGLCLIATFIFPYVALKRVNATQILQQIGYFICNIAMIGNFRIMMKHMKWTSKTVIFYKIAKLFNILFYLIFGAFYIIDDISYSKGTNDTLDGKVQNLVILYVFSGFALQLQVFNKISDFDKTCDLEIHYEIRQEEQSQKLSQNSIQKNQTTQKVNCAKNQQKFVTIENVNKIKIVQQNKK